jgi:hypothetical protein
VGDRGAQPRRLSPFRELKFTYVVGFSPCNPKDKTTMSAAMLITTSRVALGPTGSANLANSAGLRMKPPAFSVPRFAPRMPSARVRLLGRNLAARVRLILRITELGHQGTDRN